MLEPRLSVDEVDAFIGEVYPSIWIDEDQRDFRIERIGPGEATLRMYYKEKHLRPGGTISGPAMMSLCDLAMWTVVLAHIGPFADAVTANLNINFLRRPGQADLVAMARLLKLGRRLAVGDVIIHCDGDDRAVAHCTCSYAIPKTA